MFLAKFIFKTLDSCFNFLTCYIINYIYFQHSLNSLNTARSQLTALCIAALGGGINP